TLFRSLVPGGRHPAAHTRVGLDDFRGARLRHERLVGVVLSGPRDPPRRARLQPARRLAARYARPEASSALSARMASGARAIVVVGGGLMGLSAAFHLRRADPQVQVTVLERARVGDAASSASAAGVRVMGRAPAVRAWATAARRLGARIEEGVGADALVVERARVVAILRSDGARLPCDVALVAGGAWSASLLAKIGLRFPFRGRGLQMLLTDSAP